jgi:hypothetical protein
MLKPKKVVLLVVEAGSLNGFFLKQHWLWRQVGA